MTRRFANKLGLQFKEHTAVIGALNNIETQVEHVVTATVKSRLGNFRRNLEFLIVPDIAGFVPDSQIDRGKCQIPANLQLADPAFHRPAPVDMLLGAGPTLAAFCIGQCSLRPSNQPDLLLQKTQFGWIIGGSLPAQPAQTRHRSYLANLSVDLDKFWELEETTLPQMKSTEEKMCEEHFATTVERTEEGRYMVALPFNHQKELLGESRDQAHKRLLSLERRFQRDQDLKKQYAAVMEEYAKLGHMSEVQEASNEGFYLPHHAVIKTTSATTKVRVVFDGSARSTTGVSLNDALMVGPTIQDDLFSLLLRFRMHQYVITGDIEKMYRQFLVRPEDRKYQRILWRNQKNEIATFELHTVTFGLSAAPYLAIRCLQQLAEDESAQFPVASRILQRDVYVDDLITGADTLEEAGRIMEETRHLLSKGGLNIRQWASNDPQLLEGLSKDQINLSLQLDDTPAIKTLGLFWDSRSDSISYKFNQTADQKITKRSILSTIARIFDPLGLLGPTIMLAKVIIQRLWQSKVDWDESLPTQIHTEWQTLLAQLPSVSDFAVPRFTSIQDAHRIELHGFCDASEKAYGACLYLRAISRSSRKQIRLLCSKSRVSPLKTVSLPRLELCGAVLLSRLYTAARKALPVDFDGVYFWTDSTIVLNWLARAPNTLKTFVANRVSEVQEKTTITDWRHVRSEDNPADAISRGLLPIALISHTMWVTGPKWLQEDRKKWPVSQGNKKEIVPDVKKTVCLSSHVTDTDLLTRWSSIKRMRRVISYIRRLIPQNRKYKGPLHAEEIEQANVSIIKMTQASSFALEIKDLRNSRPLHPKSKLLPLNPFLDKGGILRVGGRLRNATLPFNQKHPILLPKSHQITEMIMREAHTDTHHAGVTTTLYAVRQNYWPIDGRNLARKVVRGCIKCFRAAPPATTYIMGDLPQVRVTEVRPFTNVGVDYCGPFFIKEKRHRNRNRLKVYISVFVCLATKAIHLEVVSDMTTEAFIAALRRFISRRGICRNLYSDNGTTFVGTKNEFQHILQQIQDDPTANQFLTEKQIRWHFIPPASPHFGGIWEAAVKSFKHHMKRVIGDDLFTFEDLNTFVIEVEAVLNSRPLTPLSPDPNDMLALTPGHFLIGSSFTSLPEVDVMTVPSNRLSHWQHIQKIKQHFWNRWYKEYVNLLNSRTKWTKGQHSIQKGTLVVLKENNLPPSQWCLGRVEEVRPGSDGVIRAVTVKTARGRYDRNVRCLAPLPVHNTDL